MSSRPNILFLFSDQQRADTIGIDNPAISTPSLDRLAREGMLFERAYPPTPVCLPCRASMVTGQYSSTHGARHNHSALPEEYSPTLAGILSDSGYFTHMIGKSHLSNCHDPAGREAAPHIHNREYFRTWHGPWYGFQRADIAIGHTTEKHACGMHYGVWLEEQGVDTAKYFGHTAYDAFGEWDLPEQYHSSKWIADVTIDSLRQCADRGRPFFIWSNFQDPHNPCMVPSPWSRMYDPHKIPRFGFKQGEPESFRTKPPFYPEIIDQPGEYAAHPSDPGMPSAGNVSHLGYTPEQTAQNAACYYGMVSLMDHHVGRILAALDETGLAGNTIVVFTSDHPDCLGDHGFWYKSLLCFEEILRVPMIVRFPGQVPAGTRSRAFQNTVDLPATFLSYAGIPAPSCFEGVDQRRSWEDPAVNIRSDTIVEEHPFSTDFAYRILIDDSYKLAYYAGREWGELYDMRNDPDHIKNLWSSAAHRDIRERMIRRILQHEMTRHRPNPDTSRRSQWHRRLVQP